MRARSADSDGTVIRDGVEIRYERYGEGSPAILLLPTWSLVHSRHWKMQIPHLARHFTVVSFDGRGSGGSGRPAGASAYSDSEFASDALAVMDAAGVDRAVLVSVSPSVSSAHPVASSICFVECCSVKMLLTKKATNSG